ncbi:macrophage migration inhibitory factor-like [Epargyreus clarus]|uniref:macrophage migration inhibitory factor-like n=1 Tax=Epargyreus clarus TaxID=520877 RepID=UPI003C2E81F5
MPCFKILTNIPKSSIPKDFVDKIIPVLAKAVRKPEYKFVCAVSSDCVVSFGEDSTLPGAVASLESIGHISPEDNRVVTKELSEFMDRELGIKPERFFISFYDLQAQNIGKGGVIISETAEFRT